MDDLAARGTVGLVQTVPEGLPPGSDVANLAVLGYNPQECYTGRAPLEAASMGVELGPEDVAFRCNLVTLSEDEPYAAKVMVDYSAGEISSADARELIAAVQERLGSEEISFYPGVSYRHLMVWRGGPAGTVLTPPHDITGRVVGGYLPQGEGAQFLIELMEESARFLPEYPVNRQRKARGQNPANSVWFWGQGRRPQLALFRERFGLAGSVIAAVDLIRGIGVLAGMRVPAVPGATGNIHTNYRGKAQAAIAELTAGQEFVFIHIEAADEAGHQGDLQAKIRAIEEIDAKVVGEVLAGLKEGFPDWRLMVLPDHPTPLSLRTHTAEPVPFVIAGSRTGNRGVPAQVFTEAAAENAGLLFADGWELLPYFLRVR
jgi:2,3-bisphosphoglycerate-independent phosphoglycerate mutase